MIWKKTKASRQTASAYFFRFYKLTLLCFMALCKSIKMIKECLGLYQHVVINKPKYNQELRGSLNLKQVSTLQTQKITNHKLQITKLFDLYYMLCYMSAQSYNEDGSNLSKPCFGFCFCCSFVNKYKNSIMIFLNMCVICGS